MLLSLDLVIKHFEANMMEVVHEFNLDWICLHESWDFSGTKIPFYFTMENNLGDTI